MPIYTDLNQIIQEYLISRRGGLQEFQDLQERLSNVPVSLVEFEKYLREDYSKIQFEFSNLITRAELYNPVSSMGFLNELVEQDEADNLTEKIVKPYPLLKIDSEPMSYHFHISTMKRLGELILPDKRDPTSRVLSRRGVSAVAVVYERKNKVNYLEIILGYKIIS